MLFNPLMFGLLDRSIKTKKEAAVSDIVGVPGITVKGGILGTGGKVGSIEMPYSKYQPTVVSHAPYEVFAPQVQYSPTTGYAYTGATTIIGSPGATSKKEAVVTQKPDIMQRGAWDIPLVTAPHYEQPEISKTGMNITHIAIIAVIGAAGIMLIKSKKK